MSLTLKPYPEYKDRVSSGSEASFRLEKGTGQMAVSTYAAPCQT